MKRGEQKISKLTIKLIRNKGERRNVRKKIKNEYNKEYKIKK